MGTYTTSDFIKELERRKVTFDKSKVIFPCASAAHDSQIRRMTEHEENGENKKLVENYSTKWLSVSAFNTPKKPKRELSFVPFNKENRQRTGKKGYYAYVFPEGQGYKQFKAEIGRKQFQLFGTMMKDFTNSLQRQGEYWITGMKDKNNGDKAKHLMHKYGKVSFELTKQEKAQYNNCINNKLIEILKGEANA